MNTIDKTEMDYKFLCCLCQENQLKSERGAIGNLLVIVDADELEFSTGFYEILDYPYWYSNDISAGLDAHRLRRIGDVSSHVDTHRYPLGLLCNQCSLKIKEFYESI